MINPIRHMQVFSPDAFGDRQVDVIGVGATGSRIVQGLCKLGVRNIVAWDFDTVEAHNVANQIYGLEHVGMLKVEALQKIMRASTGTDITVHAEAVDGSQELGDYVFLLTDSMKSRKQIWNGGIRYKPSIRCMIETRMGVDQGRVYTIQPINPAHVREWEKSLSLSDMTERSACGSPISVGATADFLAGLALWQFIRDYSVENGADDIADQEILFGLRPMIVTTRRFK